MHLAIPSTSYVTKIQTSYNDNCSSENVKLMHESISGVNSFFEYNKNKYRNDTTYLTPITTLLNIDCTPVPKCENVNVTLSKKYLKLDTCMPPYSIPTTHFFTGTSWSKKIWAYSLGFMPSGDSESIFTDDNTINFAKDELDLIQYYYSEPVAIHKNR